jgi:uncharacterized glyoxalase superfamily protein PhnB
MTVKPVPDGYHTVTPYLVVPDAPAFIEFLGRALGATERMRMPSEGSAIMHAEVQVGDSVIMLASATDVANAKTAMLHIYLPDVDAAYQRAITAGCESMREPADQTYGDRSAGVKDRWGNEWWLATHIKDVAFA